MLEMLGMVCYAWGMLIDFSALHALMPFIPLALVAG